MVIKKEIIIHSDIEKCWDVLGMGINQMIELKKTTTMAKTTIKEKTTIANNMYNS
ncbi:MAG: hypothetical protein JKX68_04195 [Flavobacteriales bacterium]|nr:hypothetical protein [Flavobacteriales bacterium]